MQEEFGEIDGSALDMRRRHKKTLMIFKRRNCIAHTSFKKHTKCENETTGRYKNSRDTRTLN